MPPLTAYRSPGRGNDDSNCPNAFGISDSSRLSFTDDESSIEENDYIIEQPKRTRKRVQFADVQIREYNLVLDENSSRKLYPITLDWEHSNTVTMNIDDHISLRQADKWNRVIIDPTKIGRKAFRLNAHLRFARIHSVSGVEKLHLYQMEVSRHQAMQDQMAMTVR